MSAATNRITSRDKLELANSILLDKRLSAATRVVGWLIVDHLNTRHGYAWPAQEAIAAKLGFTKRTVQRAVKKLDRYLRVRRRRTGLANEYRPTSTGDKLSPTGDKLSLSRGRKCRFGSDKKDPPSLLIYPLKKETRAPARKITEAKFEAFKAAYPKRNGSQGWQSAKKHFDAAITKNGVSADDLIAAASKFASKLPDDTRGTKFVPMAETWLRKKNYSEYLPAPPDHEAEKQRDATMRARGYEWRDDRWTKVDAT